MPHDNERVTEIKAYSPQGMRFDSQVMHSQEMVIER